MIASGGGLLAAPAPEPNPATKRLSRAARELGAAARVTVHPATGEARFVRFFEPVELDGSETDPLATAGAALERFGSLFGLGAVTRELELVERRGDALGWTHVEFRQVHRGIPVLGAVMRVHLDGLGRLRSIHGTFVPRIDLDVRAKLTPEQALRHVSGIALTPPKLMVFREGLIAGLPGRDRLVYRVDVDDAAGPDTLLVDARRGHVVERFSWTKHAIDRRVYDGGFDGSFEVWREGDPFPYSGKNEQAVNEVLEGTADIYNLLATVTGGIFLSWDGQDGPLHNVLNDPVVPCPNASWNGEFTQFCPGVTADDTVGHEWSHAYGDQTHRLIPLWQPGALGEAHADLWGEVVDLLNGRGTDAPGGRRAEGVCSSFGSGGGPTEDTYRWLIGEDDMARGGARRDLWTPTCFGDPGKVSDSQYHCSSADSGGVHHNSGIPAHAFALLVDGGSFNGRTVAAIGLTRATRIYWRAQSAYLLPTSDFADHADALEQACDDLVGAELFVPSTSSATAVAAQETVRTEDCEQVAEAMLAVEQRLAPLQCSFEPLLDPDPPALCGEVGPVVTILSQEWEAGLTGWIAGTRDVISQNDFDTGDWALVGDLPDGRGGTAAFVENSPLLGDCVEDIEAGVLYLETPTIVIPVGADVPRLAFEHWVALEGGWDGGNVKVSVNGGAWVLVPTGPLDFNGYPRTLNGIETGNDNPLAGEPAFTGADGGSVRGSWGQSQLRLDPLVAPGDAVRLRFELGLDGCNGLVGWYVDEVRLYFCENESPAGCGDGILQPGEICDDGNEQEGDGCSASCEPEEGWFCSDPVLPGATNALMDGGFETGTPNPFWEESSQQFGTPLCSFASCGDGGGTGARSGAWWVWFGGSHTPEVASVEQTTAIPVGSDRLQLYYESVRCDSQADTLELSVDGETLFRVDGASPRCGIAGYAPVTLDIGAFADGEAHTIRLEARTFAVNGDVSSFFVDDLFIASGAGWPSVCAPLICRQGSLPIPDDDPAGVTDSLQVPVDGQLEDLDVFVRLAHTFVGDLTVSLEHVTSETSATLINRPGTTPGSCSGNDVELFLDDGATLRVQSDCRSGANPAAAYLVGEGYRPFSPLSAFHGHNYGGEWRLTVADNAGADTGTLLEWCVLTLCDVRPPGPARELRFVDRRTLVWESSLGPGGTLPIHDLLRSTSPADFDPVTCVLSDSLATEASDESIPPPGGLFFYVVRSQNACPGGLGTVGFGSNDELRQAPGCP